MKVLIACEYSGTTREAFAALGHDVWSCDILPTDVPGNHYQGDVRNILGDGWDLMIGHPPCQYLTFAGMKYWNNEGRAEKREKAISFFIELYNAPIPFIAIENPRGYPFQVFRRPDQEIHPYMFGESAMKRTCLWLKNLPKLIHSPVDNLFDRKTHCPKPEPIYIDKGGSLRHFTDAMWDNGGHKRSKSFESIAQAMATQWTEHIQSQLIIS